MKIGVLINFKIQDIILGYLQKDVNYDLINLLIMCTEKYRFQCTVNYNKYLCLFFLIKNGFSEHLTL